MTEVQIKFRTHTGEIVFGERLRVAISKVSADLVALANDIYIENAYGPHVTEQEKCKYRLEGIQRALEVGEGKHLGNFSIWQRINGELTGECVGLLP